MWQSGACNSFRIVAGLDDPANVAYNKTGLYSDPSTNDPSYAIDGIISRPDEFSGLTLTDMDHLHDTYYIIDLGGEYIICSFIFYLQHYDPACDPGTYYPYDINYLSVVSSLLLYVLSITPVTRYYANASHSFI